MPCQKKTELGVTPQHFRRMACFAFASMFLFWISCSTVPQKKPDTPLELVRKDQDLGALLREHFESKLHLKNEPEVKKYLDQIALKMNPPPAPTPSPSPLYSISPADGALLPKPAPTAPPPVYSISLVERADAQWTNYSFPTETILLNVHLLKALAYENEIAADIALEIAHLQARDLNAILPNAQTWNDELFEYSEDLWLGAVDRAVGLLYHAGYDPRGLISLIEIFKAHPKNTVISASILDKMTERARIALAAFSPLRNPVVRSTKFMLIRKRILGL